MLIRTALSDLFDGKTSSDSLVKFVAQLCNEGSATGLVSNWTPMKAELVHSIATIDDMASTSDKDDSVASFFRKWCSAPMGDLLSRSTSGSSGGEAVRSAEGAEPIEILQNVVLSWLLDDNLIIASAITRDGDVKPGIDFSVDGTHVVDIDHEKRLKRWALGCCAGRNAAMMAANCESGVMSDSQIAAVWAAHRTESARGGDLLSPAGTLELVEGPEAQLAYAHLVEDPYLYLCCLYPRAHPRLRLAGMTFDVTQMLEIAAQKIEDMIARHTDPSAVVTFALFDALDFRRKGVALVMALSGEVVATFSEHAAIKVQRLGSRPLSIQADVPRIVQDMHQNFPRLVHIGSITGVRGAESTARLANLSGHLAEVSLPGATNPTAEDARSGNMTAPAASLTSLLGRTTQERRVAAAWEVAMAPILTAATYVTSLTLTEQSADFLAEGLKECDLAAIEELANCDESDEVITPCVYTAKALRYAIDFSNSCTKFHALLKVAKGTTPLGASMMAYNDSFRGAEVALSETDAKAFTLAAPIGMTTMHVYGKRLNFDTMPAVAAANLLYFSATRRSIYMVSDKMGEGGRLHGAGCRCYDKKLLGGMFPRWFHKYTAIPEEFTWGPSCGAVSQGMDAPATTYYVFLGLCGLWRPHHAGVNGDDGAGGMRVPAMPRDWSAHRKAMEGSYGAETLQCGRMKALLCHANLIELLWGRSYGAASAGIIPSAKKCSTGLATGASAATTLVYRVLRAGEYRALETRGPNVAMVIGPQQQRSLPALLSNAYRVGYAGATAESDPSLLPREVFDVCSVVAPNLGKQLERVTGRQTISIWSGSGTLLSGAPEAARNALEEVGADHAAPDFAKVLASQGLLVLPKGPVVGSEYRKNDWIAAGCAKMTTPSAKRILQFRGTGRTCSFADWVARGYGLAKPCLDPKDYQGESAIDLRQVKPDAVKTTVFLHTGDKGPGLPMHTLQALINKPYTGGSRYTAMAFADLRGAVHSTEYLHNGFVKTVYSPLWAASNPELHCRVNIDAWATILLAGPQYGIGTLQARVRVSPQARDEPWGRLAFSAECAGTRLLGLLQLMTGDKLDCQYYSVETGGEVMPEDLAQAVLRYAAPRVQRVPGKCSQLSMRPDDAKAGVLLGAGEPVTLNGVKLPKGFPEEGPLSVAIKVYALPPESTASGLNRMTVADALQQRRTGPVPSVLSAKVWYEQSPALPQYQQLATEEITTDDALVDTGRCRPPRDIINGGTLELSAACVDIAAAKTVPVADREQLLYSLHSSIRKSQYLVSASSCLTSDYQCNGSALVRTPKPGSGQTPASSTCTGVLGLYKGLCIVVLMMLG